MATRVLVLAEHRAGQVEPITHQLLQLGRRLTEDDQSLALLLLAGPDSGLAECLLTAGAGRIYLAEDEAFASYNPEACCRAVEEAVRRVQPGVLLCGHTFQGMEVAPWVAARLAAPLASNCLDLRREGDEIVAERAVYGGAWRVQLKLPACELVVATLARTGSSGAAPATSPFIERLDLSLALGRLGSTVLESVLPETGEGDITKADLVVGVGRGIQDPANLAMMQDLADALGGVIACSRPLVDLEWMPQDRQVGASGRDIASRVYLACGISGAAQHLAGIRGVQTVIAINKDPAAPIFGLSHYGVAGDLFEVVPALIEEARRRRGF